jgi:integrase
MATFVIVLDKRVKKKEGKYNFAIRVSYGSDIMYINLSKMTEAHYNKVFVKRSMDAESIQDREKCAQYISKCERIHSELKPFNKERFRSLFWERGTEKPNSLLLRDLFAYFIENNHSIKLKTKSLLKGTANVLEKYRKDVSVGDITPEFLRRFIKAKMDEHYSRATVDSHLRHLRRIINYFTNEVKTIPEQYKYPFGKSGCQISSYFPRKIVLSEKEINLIIDMTEFESPEEEYARDIFLMSYYCNGSNFVDLLRMRWGQISGTYITLIRKKTETTRKNNIKDIVIPIVPKLQVVLNRVGVKSSLYILGQIKEGYSESFFENRNHKLKRKINAYLSKIGKRLGLSTPLNYSKARDCYATTLMRNGIPIYDISEALGHSDIKTTIHYLASLDIERTFEINSCLL